MTSEAGNTLSIRARILGACLAMTMLTGALGLLTLKGQDELSKLAMQIYDRAFMSVNFFRSAQNGFSNLQNAFKVGEPTDYLQTLAARMDADLVVAIERASSDDARQIASSLHQQSLDLLAPLLTRAAIGSIIARIEPVFDIGAEQFAQDGFAFRLQAETVARDSKILGDAALIASLLAALVITASLTRSIVPPLCRATTIAREIARGNFDNTIETTGSQEIGQLLGALAIMQQALIERAAAAQRADHLAHHDLLTGLANRLAFSNQMRDALGRQPSEPFALLLLDLDRFKPVNDTFGHAAGDELLGAVAKRISRCVAMADIVARIGGDEFAILHRGRTASAEQVAHRVITALGRPFDLSNGTVTIGVSIGIKLWQGETDGDELFRAADSALYAVKNSARGGWRNFDDGSVVDLPARLPAQLPPQLPAQLPAPTPAIA